MCKTISFSLAFILALCVVATVQSANIKLCSEQLNDMLARLCVRGFNSIIDYRKRSSPQLDADPLDPIQYIEQMESPKADDLLPYPLSNGRLRKIFQQEAFSSLTATRRRTRGQIVQECCERPCKLEELTAYCAA